MYVRYSLQEEVVAAVVVVVVVAEVHGQIMFSYLNTIVDLRDETSEYSTFLDQSDVQRRAVVIQEMEDHVLHQTSLDFSPHALQDRHFVVPIRGTDSSFDAVAIVRSQLPVLPCPSVFACVRDRVQARPFHLEQNLSLRWEDSADDTGSVFRFRSQSRGAEAPGTTKERSSRVDIQRRRFRPNPSQDAIAAEMMLIV
jgi:hypothetical protein